MDPIDLENMLAPEERKFERIQTNDPKLTEVYFHKTNVDDHFLETLAASLETNTFLIELSIKSQPICAATIHGWSALFQMLQVKRTIRKLVFSECNFNFECAQLFATIVLLNDNVLTHVKLEHNEQLGINGALAILNALSANPNGCKLTFLSLFHVMEESDITMQNRFAMKLVTLLHPNNNMITELELGGNYLGDDFVAIFANELKCNTCLLTLNLGQNEITHVGALSLAHALNYNKTLVNLHLSSNFIGDNGAIAVTTALWYHPRLEVLDIGYNGLTVDGLVQSFDFLRYNESVKQLKCCQGPFNIPYDMNELRGEFVREHEELDVNMERHEVDLIETQLYSAIESILDYNDVIHYFDLCMDVLYSNEYMIANKNRNRKAPKKGLLRRQLIYMQLNNDFFSISRTVQQER